MRTKTMSKTNRTMTTVVSGTAAFSESEKKGKSIGFTPKTSGNKLLQGFNGNAYVITSPDGRFVVKIKKRDWRDTNVVKRMNHGCLTLTRDDAVLLTIKVFHPEENDVPRILINEAWEAAEAYRELTEN
ncbi:MAG: hypothetical protein J6T44_10700 [Prevotella sp.]|nr:hypothetical protein [Prevotella sp.]MBO7539739.1 hypothetical protein [Prevotella sp.]